MPIEIGLPRRFAPSVGLRRRKECLPGRCRPTAGRRPLRVEFIRRPGRPSAEGFRADWKSASPGADAPSVGPFAPIEIGLPGRCAPGVGLRRRRRCSFDRRRPTVGRRPPEVEFIRRPRLAVGQRLSHREIDLPRNFTPSIIPRQRSFFSWRIVRAQSLRKQIPVPQSGCRPGGAPSASGYRLQFALHPSG